MTTSCETFMTCLTLLRCFQILNKGFNVIVHQSARIPCCWYGHFWSYEPGFASRWWPENVKREIVGHFNLKLVVFEVLQQKSSWKCRNLSLPAQKPRRESRRIHWPCTQRGPENMAKFEWKMPKMWPNLLLTNPAKIKMMIHFKTSQGTMDRCQPLAMPKINRTLAT